MCRAKGHVTRNTSGITRATAPPPHIRSSVHVGFSCSLCIRLAAPPACWTGGGVSAHQHQRSAAACLFALALTPGGGASPGGPLPSLRSPLGKVVPPAGTDPLYDISAHFPASDISPFSRPAFVPYLRPVFLPFSPPPPPPLLSPCSCSPKCEVMIVAMATKTRSPSGFVLIRPCLSLSLFIRSPLSAWAKRSDNK